MSTFQNVLKRKQIIAKENAPIVLEYECHVLHEQLQASKISSRQFKYSSFLQCAKVYRSNDMLMTFACMCAILAVVLQNFI